MISQTELPSSSCFLWFSRFAICSLLLFPLGCRGGNDKESASVRGTVLLDGEPVSDGQVIFEFEAKGVTVGAPLNPDGTFKFDADLPLGDYRVYLLPYSPPSISPEDLEKLPPYLENVPRKFQSAATADLSASVSAGNNKVLFELKSKGP